VEKDDDDDDNFVPNEDGELVLAPSSKKKKSSSTKKKKNLKPVLAPKSFKSLMEVGEAVDYEAAAFPDSVLPVRKFCCVCGLLAPYRCPRCSQCFCCIKCDETHKVSFQKNAFDAQNCFVHVC
jgi:hypothetical protein